MDDPKYLWIGGILGWVLIFVLIVVLDRVFNLGLDGMGRLSGKKDNRQKSDLL